MQKIVCILVLLLLSNIVFGQAAGQKRKTVISIREEKFYINGKPTFKGRTWNGYTIEGLLPNSRMVQGIFDDLNPETKVKWKYPDSQKWDAGRNTREFIEAMPLWKQYGLLAFTLNLQGGSPEGYSKNQPWHNSAITENGDLLPAYMQRLEQIITKADELGMVVILGIFYFGQDERVKDEAAVIRAVDNTINWLFEKNYTNVLIEINNECDIAYNHEILKPDRVHELIERVKNTQQNGRRFLVSTSYGGGTLPKPNVLSSADFVLLHGNGVSDPNRVSQMVQQTRKVEGYRPMPIVFNEDDHFDFDKPINNFVAATSVYASWGYFDFRMKDEGLTEGYQSVPVNWGISSARKEGFFKKLKEITGGLK
ncbi:glycoside hydrolase family 5 protein [Rhodocytophaga rosea]|uniref:Glycoside hydrolase family 5 protein n=1 Tax=Rhodocytophaga rosea TaxID=2704465 RepID=A0A6C0GNE9_9BACT|nr:glycoside hydrolase family 5 protein [Rhodocytophaga rosea]QHT69555.1 glycoside hydrolase family 5 protein [Rhodocytophaga rosea]